MCSSVSSRAQEKIRPQRHGRRSFQDSPMARTATAGSTICSATKLLPDCSSSTSDRETRDKPAHYKYCTTERADLVEAQWANHRIERTTIVTFDYSSLVL